MKDIVKISLLGLLPTTILASTCDGPNARTTPPEGALIVDQAGSATGSFKTVSEAVAALDATTTSPQTIFIHPGTYPEQVHILPIAGALTFQGYTCDSTAYAANEVTITSHLAQKDIPANITGESRNDNTAALRLKSDNFKGYNINFANTAGDVGQALAVNLNATDVGFYACNFTGYQDTILSDKGRQLFVKSYIAGAIDFIFGRYAKSWFQSCDIEAIGDGYITASGRENATNDAWYVFEDVKVFGSGSVTLGRPWRPYARVTFQNSEIGEVVRPEGWSEWAGSTDGTDNVVFLEFNNTGPSADRSQRAAFSSEATEAIKIEDIFGADYASADFVDVTYLEG